MAKPYKILFLASWYPHRGGPTFGNFVERHAQAVALGHEVEVLYLTAESGLNQPEFESVQNGRLTEHRVYHPASLGRLRKIKLFRKALKTFWNNDLSSFNLVHLNVFHPAGWQAVYLKRFFDLPFVVTEHWTGFHNGRFANMPALHQRLARRTAAESSAICPVSQHLAHAMQANGLPGSYSVVPNVVNTDLFVPEENASRRMPHLLHVSHLGDAHKNVSGLLRGLKKTLDQGHRLHLEIIGDGDLTPHRETAVELGLPVWAVSFSGEQPIEMIAEHMQQADAFVLFSNYENLPCVLIEAWSSGVPTISTDVGGISEHLTPERGWLIPPGDEDQLTAALVEVSERSFDTSALRGYALEHFSESAVCEAFTAVYQRVLA